LKGEEYVVAGSTGSQRSATARRSALASSGSPLHGQI